MTALLKPVHLSRCFKRIKVIWMHGFKFRVDKWQPNICFVDSQTKNTFYISEKLKNKAKGKQYFVTRAIHISLSTREVFLDAAALLHLQDVDGLHTTAAKLAAETEIIWPINPKSSSSGPGNV